MLPRMKLNEIEPSQPGAPLGDVLWVGDVELKEGVVSVRLSLPQKCVADLILVTSDKTIAGWRLAKEPS